MVRPLTTSERGVLARVRRRAFGDDARVRSATNKIKTLLHVNLLLRANSTNSLVDRLDKEARVILNKKTNTLGRPIILALPTAYTHLKMEQYKPRQRC